MVRGGQLRTVSLRECGDMASPVSLVEEFLGLLSPKGFKSVSGTLKPLKEAASPLSIAGEAQPLLGEKLWDAPAPKYKGFTTKAFATPELELTKEKSSPAKGIERAAAQFIERSRTKLMPSEKVRAERAKEQGYNVEAYHSTPTDVPFEEFRLTNEDIGMHFGTKQASSARLEAVSSRGERPRTYPVKLQANNPLELWDMGTWEAEKIEGALKHALKWDRAEVEAAAKKGMQGLRDLIKSKGYDSIKYVNEHEDPGSISYITLDPSQARSQFAKFNPRQSGKAHLAGALAGGAAAGALAMGGDEAQALPKIPTISGKMAGVEFKVTEAQYEQLKAARAAGAGREGISRMVEEFQRGVAPKGTLTPASVMDVESRVREAYSTLTRGQYNQPVYLKDIRDLLKDVPEQQLNRALHNIHLQPGATLSGINNPQAITPAIKAGGTDFKGTPMYVLWMQKQAPKAAAGGAAAGALAMGGDEAQAAPLAIAGEPQPLSVAGEAQPLAIAGKPQPLSIAGEAQPLGARPGISATDIIKGAGTLAAGPLAPLAFIAQYAEPGRIGKAPGKIAEVRS